WTPVLRYRGRIVGMPAPAGRRRRRRSTDQRAEDQRLRAGLVAAPGQPLGGAEADQFAGDDLRHEESPFEGLLQRSGFILEEPPSGSRIYLSYRGVILDRVEPHRNDQFLDGGF